MQTYGLSEYDLEVAREKIRMQRKYLTDTELITSNGQVKSLLDLSFSANHSYRYYAQLANKINTIEQLALNNGLVPIFATMTLDGFYRDLIKGDYRRLINMRSDKRKEVFKSVPDNERFGFIRTKMQNCERLTIKELYKILMFQNHQFRMGTAFKQLLRSGMKFEYIRTVEPHKDGVPHFHIMLFIPENFIGVFHKDFKRYFVAPRNQLDISFQSDIGSASAYIMKYITKTFIDIKKNKELDYINAWFVKHRIMRCVTSRSTLPQWIYKKVSILEKDWYYLTDILNSPRNHSEWNQELNCFWIYDTWSDREIAYEYGRLSIYSSGRLIHQVGKVVDNSKKTKSFDRVPKTWTKKSVPVPIYNQYEQITHYFYKGKYMPYKKHITQMTDTELVRYHNSYDVENDNYTHYLAVKNLMISRGLLYSNFYNLNNFDFNEFMF